MITAVPERIPIVELGQQGRGQRQWLNWFREVQQAVAEGVDLSEVEQDLAALTTRVSTVENRVTVVEGRITTVETRITTAEGNITNLQSRVTTLEGKTGGEWVGSTAGQIPFPVTQVPSASPNVFDDYREGSYTPVWASGGSPDVALGNGTLVGHYVKTGRQVSFVIYLQSGSTTSFGNSTYAWTLTLPFMPQGSIYQPIFGTASDAGVGVYTVYSLIAGALAFAMGPTTGVGGPAAGSNVCASVPHTWAASDYLVIGGTYLAAQ